MATRRYKFQALVATSQAAAGGAVPPGALRRMVVRGEHRRTHRSHFFTALVTNNGDGADWLGDAHEILTIALRDPDAGEYFRAGDHVSLWLGHDVADGVVTRRLFI